MLERGTQVSAPLSNSSIHAAEQELCTWQAPPPSMPAWNMTESICEAAFCYIEQAESLTGCIQLEHVATDANMAPTSPTKGDHRWQQYRKAFTP
jgi:hypothetical protein